MLDVRSPDPEAKATRIRVFVSYARESDGDLYALLATTVREARKHLKMGHRTQGSKPETLAPDESGLVELPVETDEKGGILGWIPAFLRQLTGG